MAQELYHQYAANQDVNRRSVRDAVSELDGDDLSVSSPISAGATEVGIDVTGMSDEPGGFVHVTVSGHDGDWTKTSEQALKSAVQSVDGVGELVSSDGGYESE